MKKINTVSWSENWSGKCTRNLSWKRLFKIFQDIKFYQGSVCQNAVSALTLLAGHQEEHLARKNWMMWCWCGYLSGARCRLFTYGPADATAIPKSCHLLPHLNPDWFYLSGTGLPRLSRKKVSPSNGCSSCWLGGRKGIRTVKNRVVGCWRGCLSGARCRLAYSPADATATHCLLLQ